MRAWPLSRAVQALWHARARVCACACMYKWNWQTSSNFLEFTEWKKNLQPFSLLLVKKYIKLSRVIVVFLKKICIFQTSHWRFDARVRMNLRSSIFLKIEKKRRKNTYFALLVVKKMSKAFQHHIWAFFIKRAVVFRHRPENFTRAL